MFTVEQLGECTRYYYLFLNKTSFAKYCFATHLHCILLFSLFGVIVLFFLHASAFFIYEITPFHIQEKKKKSAYCLNALLFELFCIRF